MKLATFLLVTTLLIPNLHATNTNRGSWLDSAQYGVFIHFLGEGPTWNSRVNAFDVHCFAQQVNDCGADYVFLTLGQNSGYYCSPNRTYDTLAGHKAGVRCSIRDLPGDLADALSPYGIRLLLYLPSRAPQRDKATMQKLGDVHERSPAPQDFTRRWSNVIREWSLRYNDKISGWWFDGAYNTEGWDDVTSKYNWNTWAAACRAGNSKSILAFNPGAEMSKAFTSLTSQQDYTAGETNEWTATPKTNPAAENLHWHVLSYMGSYWGRCDEPRMSNDDMIDYIKTVNEQGGIVSIDVGINKENGTICAAHLEQLLAIRAGLQNEKLDKTD